MEQSNPLSAEPNNRIPLIIFDACKSSAVDFSLSAAVTAYFASGIFLFFAFALGYRQGISTTMLFMLLVGSAFDLLGVVYLTGRRQTDWQNEVLKPIGFGILMMGWALLMMAGIECMTRNRPEKSRTRRLLIRVWFAITVFTICLYVGLQYTEIAICWILAACVVMMFIYSSGPKQIGPVTPWNRLKFVSMLVSVVSVLAYVVLWHRCGKHCSQECKRLSYLNHNSIFNILIGCSGALLGVGELFDPLPTTERSDEETVLTLDDKSTCDRKETSSNTDISTSIFYEV